MAVLEDVAERMIDAVRPPKPIKTPKDVEEKLKRGRDRLKQLRAARQQAIEFANNNHFVSINDERTDLVPQSVVPMNQGGNMPDHRVRRSHDLIGPIVKRKVSAATQRIPSYEVNPTTADSEDYAAAKIAEKVAIAGYDLWGLKRAFKKLVWNALVTEEAFIMASWDSSVGPYVDVSQQQEEASPGLDPSSLEGPLATLGSGYEESEPSSVDVGEGDAEPEAPAEPSKPEWVGMGEVSVEVWGGLEVMWEPGVEFDKSRWYAIESARPAADIEAEEDYIPGEEGMKLKPDADYGNPSAPRPKAAGAKLVMQTDFMERPCPKYPEGRRIILANGREIFPEETYPQRDHKGRVVDEPPMKRLAYSIDGSSDRDRGLVGSLIDAMRSYDMAVNKTSEWIQVALVPQVTAPEGAITTPITDEPGLVIEYDPTLTAGQAPVFRQVPQVPPELFVAQDRAKQELTEIAHDSQIPQGVDSAKGLTAIYEKDQLAWQDFIMELADVHARLMRDCLTVVQLRYSEDRLISFRGQTGWENILDFRGADIRGQTDVRVQPGSLEPLTRAAIEAKIAKINEMFPGYFPPPVVIAALNSATPEKLIEGYEADEARAHRVISLIKTGQFWDMPERPVVPGENAPALNPETGEPEFGPLGEPVMLETLPGWMPRPFDNVDVHRAVFEGWMKTDDFERLGEGEKKAAMIYYQALQDLETRAAQRKAELQTQMAEERGMENAAKSGDPKEMPDAPKMGEEGNAGPPSPAAPSE